MNSGGYRHRGYRLLRVGRDLEETFIAAADATINVMVEEMESIQPRERRGHSAEDRLTWICFSTTFCRSWSITKTRRG